MTNKLNAIILALHTTNLFLTAACVYKLAMYLLA